MRGAKYYKDFTEEERRVYILRQKVHDDFNRDAVFFVYGGKNPLCKCCGSKNELEIDHTLGDGKKHREQMKKKGVVSRHELVKWIIKNNFPAGRFQLLCSPCNTSKGDGPSCQLHPVVV